MKSLEIWVSGIFQGGYEERRACINVYRFDLVAYFHLDRNNFYQPKLRARPSLTLSLAGIASVGAGSLPSSNPNFVFA